MKQAEGLAVVLKAPDILRGLRGTQRRGKAKQLLLEFLQFLNEALGTQFLTPLIRIGFLSPKHSFQRPARMATLFALIISVNLPSTHHGINL